MRFLIVLVVIVIGVGLYRGWFSVRSHNSNDRPAVTVTVDKDKMHQDKDEAQKKVEQMDQK